MKSEHPIMKWHSRSRWLIAAMVILMVLTSCTSPNSTPTGDVTEAVTGSTTSIPSVTSIPKATPTQETPIHLQVNEGDLAGIVVRFVHPWTGEMADTLASLAMQFSLSNEWDIWVEPEAPGGDSAVIESLESDIENNDLPGLVVTYPYLLDALDGKYFSVNLTDYFYDPEWGVGMEAQADIPAVFLEQYTSEGQLIALPVAPQGTVLFYNQTWGQALGFDEPPQNETAFQKQACEAAFSSYEDQNAENDGTGGWLVNYDPEVLASWFVAFNGELSVDGDPVFNTEAGQEAFSYLKSAYGPGCFWIGRRPEPYFYFANRYALTYAGTLDQIPDQANWMVTEGNPDSWLTMGFPGPAGETMLVNGPGLMLTADSPKNQMASWLFARFLLSSEAQAELVKSGFSLPVRQSSLAMLSDFSAQYPQWAQALALIDMAKPVPISSGWGIGQWVLQDAVYRMLQSDADQIVPILQELDGTISELEGMDP
jgi:ABC-type glycerol-3-phosphate transport system substrate-binding protein